MTRRSKIWLTVATLFTLVNLGGAWIAARSAEGMHTGVHVVLVVVGVWWMWRVVTRARGSSEAAASALPADRALDQLQQSVDAIALEVERIGEAQRYTAKVVSERPGSAPGDGGATGR